ncbi:MAG: type II secretion system protein [Deltaproteobacteria bacterium]|nr:type II secretion system protein [Deltaproteobacteria bacterium]
MTKQKGFTLIELLVVVAIIGILAAIAIPQFAAYRTNTFCASVEADVKNTVLAQEGIFTVTQAYDNTTIFETIHHGNPNTITSNMQPDGSGGVTGASTAGCPKVLFTYDQTAGTYSW